MNPGVSEEVGKTVRGFTDALKDQPLSLALVLVIVLLCAFLFYSNAQTLQQRKDAVDQIVAWQRQTDTLMAGCISKDALELVLNAVLRTMAPTMPIPVPVPEGKSALDHLLPPGPKLQSDESHPFVLPPITPLPTE